MFRNTGTQTWTKGVPGQEARLGINGDDAQWAPLAVNWPFATRVAVQSEATVAPGTNATFTFQVRAPQSPGTYALHLRPVVDGQWWSASYAGEPLVSLEERTARDLDLKIGDTITVNVLGRNVTARI